MFPTVLISKKTMIREPHEGGGSEICFNAMKMMEKLYLLSATRGKKGVKQGKEVEEICRKKRRGSGD